MLNLNFQFFLFSKYFKIFFIQCKPFILRYPLKHILLLNKGFEVFIKQKLETLNS